MKSSTDKSGRLLNVFANVLPDYFALIMATGGVSIACYLLGLTIFAKILLAANIVFYGMLSGILAVRLIRYSTGVLEDLGDHKRGPGFLTIIAGTCVLGSNFAIVAQWFTVAGYLWILALVLWVVIMYSFFTFITVRENKPDLSSGFSGNWLIAIVATQGISVLGTLLASHFQRYTAIVLFLTLVMFFIGCMLYLFLITLVFYRMTFFDVNASELSQPYWVNMGAVAITTLAGTRLIMAAPLSHLVKDVLPFLKGFTLLFWSGGTWWIPMLFFLGAWRYVYKHFPVDYNPEYWSIVFPLGMYTVCTFQLSVALNFQPLMIIPRIFVYIAIIAWSAAFIGLIVKLLRKFGVVGKTKP
ncbi:MAG: tellurite resistance/C4-dicarboxylate transporter family protein [Pyrinomonadaceae bacterium]